MASSEEIRLIIEANADNAIKQIEKLNGTIEEQAKQSQATTKSFDKMQDSWVKVVGVVAGVVSAFRKVVDESSNLEETTNKYNVALGSLAEKGGASVRELANGFKMSSEEAMNFIGDMDMLLKNMGVGAEEALKMSTEIVKLAADMGSLKNVKTADVLRDIQSAMVGQVETVRKYGVSMDEASVAQKALAMGLAKTEKEITNQDKALARLQITQEVFQKFAKGDMARSADSLANSFKGMKAKIDDTAASIGNTITPALASMARIATGALEVFLKLPDPIRNFVSAMVLAAIAIKGGAVAMQMFGVAVNTSLPILAAISTAIGGMIALYNRWKEVTADTAKNHEDMAKRNIKAMEESLAYNKEIVKKQWMGHEDAAKRIIEIERKIVSEKQKLALAKVQIDEESKKKSIDVMTSQVGDIKKVNDQKITAEQEYINKLMSMKQNGYNMEAANLRADYDKRVEYAQKEITNKQEQMTALGLLNEDYYNKLEELKDKDEQKDAQSWQKKIQVAQRATAMISQMFSQLTAIANQYYMNKSLQIDQDYNKQKQAIESSTMDETQKKDALDKLDKDTDKKKRKLQHDQAVLQKKLSIIQAIINTAQGVSSALALGPVGIPLAAIIGALGAYQVKLIANQPIPAAYEGALIEGSSQGTLIRAGERNKTEAVIPLDNDKAMEKLGGIGGATVTFNVQNMFATEDFPKQIAEKIDGALYKLWQNKGSRFAEAIS